MRLKSMPLNLKIKRHDYDKWYKEKLNYYSDEFIDIFDVPLLEVDEEEVKERKGLKSLIQKIY